MGRDRAAAVAALAVCLSVLNLVLELIPSPFDYSPQAPPLIAGELGLAVLDGAPMGRRGVAQRSWPYERKRSHSPPAVSGTSWASIGLRRHRRSLGDSGRGATQSSQRLSLPSLVGRKDAARDRAARSSRRRSARMSGSIPSVLHRTLSVPRAFILSILPSTSSTSPRWMASDMPCIWFRTLA